MNPLEGRLRGSRGQPSRSASEEVARTFQGVAVTDTIFFNVESSTMYSI